MITVATFTKPEEAHLLRMRLENAGIKAYIQDENLVQMDLLYSNAVGGVRVQVADEDLDAVKELLSTDKGVEQTPDEDSMGALADYDKGIDLATKPSGDYFHNRGCILYDMHQFEKARMDFQKSCELGLKKSSNNAYPHFRIYLIRCLLNEAQAATDELTAYLANPKAGILDDWALKIGRFLTGQLSEADFINAANDTNEKKDKSQHCEAWFYAGTKRLIAGDKATAQEDFKKCLATGLTHYFEYASSAAELKFMEQTHTE